MINVEPVAAFARERHAIFTRRERGEPPPWTLDPILQRYRFTNVFRVLDRNTQYLIANVWGARDTIRFTFFNKIETFEAIKDLETPDADVKLQNLRDVGIPLYTKAYAVPQFGKVRSGTTHFNHLRLADQMMTDGIWDQLKSAMSLRDVYRALTAYSGIGNFIGWQMTLNFNYVLGLPEDYVVVGWGAHQGIKRLSGDPTQIAEVNRVRMRLVADPTLRWQGMEPSLSDTEHVICEYERFARACEGPGRLRPFRPRGSAVGAP